MTIVPSIIAKNQKELEKRIKKVKKYTKWLQLDVMDGKFVGNSSINFDFKLPRGKYEAHLMVKDSEKWIKQHGKKVDVIIFQIESAKQPKKIINLIKKLKKKVGIAIKPKTDIKKLKPYVKYLDLVTIMTVNPGKYGAKFLPLTLKKVEKLKKLYPKLNIEVDGSINNKTIELARKAGANKFVVGSYLQKSKDVKKTLKVLEWIN